MSDWYMGELAAQDGYIPSELPPDEERAPLRIDVRPPTAEAAQPELPPLAPLQPTGGLLPKQVPGEFNPAPMPTEDRPSAFMRAMPKVYDPLQKQQQEVANLAYSFTPPGAVSDIVEAYQNKDPAGVLLGAAGGVPGLGTAAKLAAPAVKAAMRHPAAVMGGVAAGATALGSDPAEASFLKAPPGKMLDKAKRLLGEGLGVQGIWDRTGLFQGADGIWRYEVPDLGSRWKVDPLKLVGVKNLQLGSVFEHPKLFKEAPWMPKTELQVVKEHPDIGGGFLRGDPATGRPNMMEVNVNYAHDTPHGVVMHEGTHVNQFEQDMNAGTNVNTHPLSAPAQSIYEGIKRDFMTPPSEKALKEQGLLPPGMTYKKFMSEYEKAKKADPVLLENNFRRIAANKAYARSAGETEAGNVQFRANKSQDYLDTMPPPFTEGVPRDKQIVTFNDMQRRLPGLAIEPQMAKKVTGFAPGSIAEQDAAGFADPKLRAKAEGLRGTYPQYAEKYPETGPPELMWKILDNKKLGLGIGPPTPEQYASGKFLKKAGGTVPYDTLEEALAKAKEPGFFLEKKLTPEAEKFQKDRNIIQQDMDLHGYKKYFDPAKRFDVDPKKYGPFEDTAITASPKKAATQKEWETTYGTDEIRARLQAGFKEGQGIPASDRWYLMGQLEQAYIKELGPKAGREAFANEFARMMAATTGGAAPYDNFLMSHYANVVNKQGERLPDAGWKLPFPIGGRFASGNMKQAQKFIDEGIGNWPMKNPKRYDFSSAFMGNKNAGTIDEQMMTTFDPTLKVKQPVWYGPATKTLREEAGKAGVDTRGFQDVGWAGLKKQKTEAAGDKFEYEGPMIDQINRSIETTHRLTGMPIAEIVRRGLILKEIPMYGLGGLITGGAVSKMGGVADQGEYKQ